VGSFVRTVAPDPAKLPVSVADVRIFCRIPDDIISEDALLESLIKSAVDRFEHISGRACITQTWQLKLDSFWGPTWDYTFGATSGGSAADFVYFDPRAGWIIQLPVPPVQAVSSIQYVDGGGNLTTLDPTLYLVDIVGEPARISPAFGKFWPVARRQQNAVTVTYTTGYGSDGSAVPEAVKDALKTYVAYRNQHREEPDEDWLSDLFARFRYGGC
jgi:hypothetical protein